MRFSIAALCLVPLLPVVAVKAEQAIDIGARRELFVDDYLIDRLAAGAQLVAHRPTPREVVLVTDKPWEGSSCLYFTIFQDGDRYRMYYRGLQIRDGKPAHREVVCYAESRDGITWEKPHLGLVRFDGSTQNNIVWEGIGSHNFTPFLDQRPGCPPAARYKAVGRGVRTPSGAAGTTKQLFAFQSADGLHWKFMRKEPVLTDGRFDSQNLAFWDTQRECYVAYYRDSDNGRRAIRTATSADFLHWSQSRLIDYRGGPRYHLYTNAIQRYAPAPHLVIGFPTRFLPRRKFPDRPDWTEPILIAGRDGVSFRLWDEPVIPSDTAARSGNRSNYMSWGLVQLDHSPHELSLYAAEDRRRGNSMKLRRYTYRRDGLASIQSIDEPGTATTKPIRFRGERLSLNLKTQPGGAVRVELQDARGRPHPGFTLADCEPLSGDHLSATVSWRGGADVARLTGGPARIKIHVDRADLFSFQFVHPTER